MQSTIQPRVVHQVAGRLWLARREKTSTPSTGTLIYTVSGHERTCANYDHHGHGSRACSSGKSLTNYQKKHQNTQVTNLSIVCAYIVNGSCRYTNPDIHINDEEQAKITARQLRH